MTKYKSVLRIVWSIKQASLFFKINFTLIVFIKTIKKWINNDYQ